MKLFEVSLLLGAIAAVSGAQLGPMKVVPFAKRATDNDNELPPYDGTVPRCATNDSAQVNGKNGIIASRYRWRNFNIQADRSFSQREHDMIHDAMSRLQQVLPCIEFGIWHPDSRPTGDYVGITRQNSGCWSPIGRQGGRQDLNLQSPNCMNVGIVMHEMIHALGFHHEQSRPDRDDYINIHWGNIERGCERNFERGSNNEYTTYGVEYNTKSIMHYDTYACSNNRQPTITTKAGGGVGNGNNPQLQETDARKLKIMYNCN